MSVATELPKTRRVPPLESGDRLSREEFYRRWEAMPDLKFAERIEGIVYMQAATRSEAHGFPHSKLGTLFGVYAAETPGVEAGDALTVQADEDNDPQPDVCLLILPESGGQCRITADD